jgi:hypothetical protein
MFVCEAVTRQRILYICLFRGRCPTTGLHSTILWFHCRDNYIAVSQNIFIIQQVVIEGKRISSQFHCLHDPSAFLKEEVTEK